MIIKKIFVTELLALFLLCAAASPAEEVAVQKEKPALSIKNIGPVVNSSDDEFFPSITSDGSRMVFNRRPRGGSKSDIYITYNKNGEWTKPEPIKEINSGDNDETPFITEDGKTIIFASNRAGSLKPEVTLNNFQFYTEDLYVSTFNNGTWSAPRPILGDVNTVENERAPSLSSDGKTLYFSRWPLDAIEESKLMTATLVDGQFKNVTEMPAPVNSTSSDFGLMVSKSKPGFYFSSNRNGGFGLWDIYFAYMGANQIKEIINLGSTINTSENELSLSELGDKILFCSNRKGGQGAFDIYEIELPKKITDLAKTGFNIQTIDKKSGKPVSIPLEIKYVNPDKPDEKKVEQMKTDGSGNLAVVLPDNFRSIIVKNSDGRYAKVVREYKSDSGKMTDVKIEFEETPAPQAPQAAPTPTGFQNVYFTLDSCEIRIKYIPIIHDVIDYLRNNKNARLKITGYADRKGEHYHNIDLSLRRSIAVRDYMLAMGIDQGRIEVLGKGYRFPVFTGYGMEVDELCRRVEFQILE